MDHVVRQSSNCCLDGIRDMSKGITSMLTHVAGMLRVFVFCESICTLCRHDNLSLPMEKFPEGAQFRQVGTPKVEQAIIGAHLKMP